MGRNTGRKDEIPWEIQDRLVTRQRGLPQSQATETHYILHIV
jgi:hypothetical protein